MKMAFFDYEEIICIKEINQNIKNIFENKPLTKPLAVLNRNCDFRKRYEIAYDLLNEKKIKEEVKKKVREYYQKPEVKKKVREYKREYNQKPEVKKKVREYYQKPEVKERRREYYQKRKRLEEVKWVKEKL